MVNISDLSLWNQGRKQMQIFICQAMRICMLAQLDRIKGRRKVKRGRGRKIVSEKHEGERTEGSNIH